MCTSASGTSGAAALWFETSKQISKKAKKHTHTHTHTHARPDVHSIVNGVYDRPTATSLNAASMKGMVTGSKLWHVHFVWGGWV